MVLGVESFACLSVEPFSNTVLTIHSHMHLMGGTLIPYKCAVINNNNKVVIHIIKTLLAASKF